MITKIYYRTYYATKDFCNNVKYTIRNLYIFRKTLLTHRWYSYGGVYTALEDALKDMCKEQGLKDRKVNTALYVSQMKESLEALERLSTEQYDFEYESSDQYLQDKKIIANMIENQLENFWD